MSVGGLKQPLVLIQVIFACGPDSTLAQYVNAILSSCASHVPLQRRLTFIIFSRQVTAGVLRGEKSRFQLFGDVSR
jgi:hypothetical protein